MNNLSDSISIDIKKPNNLVFTFALNLHGSIRNLELTAENLTTFDNCRLFSRAIAGNSKDISTNNSCMVRSSDKPNYEALEDNLHRDSYKSTFDIILESENNQITPLPRITYDKMLSITNNLIDSFQYGIYLISVNEKQEDGLFKFKPQLFPGLLNLLYVDQFKKFASFFGTNINNFDSEIFESTYNDLDFRLWTGIELSKNKKKIMKIKMSKFIELIKSIVGSDNYFNLIDYSCSVNVTNVNIKGYNIQPLDIENIAGEKKWGGKRRMTKTNKRRITKTNKKRLIKRKNKFFKRRTKKRVTF
jgi:hypothetical protein